MTEKLHDRLFLYFSRSFLHGEISTFVAETSNDYCERECTILCDIAHYRAETSTAIDAL